MENNIESISYCTWSTGRDVDIKFWAKHRKTNMCYEYSFKLLAKIQDVRILTIGKGLELKPPKNNLINLIYYINGCNNKIEERIIERIKGLGDDLKQLKRYVKDKTSHSMSNYNFLKPEQLHDYLKEPYILDNWENVYVAKSGVDDLDFSFIFYKQYIILINNIINDLDRNCIIVAPRTTSGLDSLYLYSVLGGLHELEIEKVKPEIRIEKLIESVINNKLNKKALWKI